MLFSGSPASGQTLVVGFVECSDIAFCQICLPEDRASCLKVTASLQDSVYLGQKDVYDNYRGDWLNTCMREIEIEIDGDRLCGFNE